MYVREGWFVYVAVISTVDNIYYYGVLRRV